MEVGCVCELEVEFATEVGVSEGEGVEVELVFGVRGVVISD